MGRPVRFTAVLTASLLLALFLSSVLAEAAPVPRTSCVVFPADNIWNTDIFTLPVHARSPQWLQSLAAATTNLHPDFGAPPYGFPFNVVDNTHPLVSPTFQYAAESDPGPYPIGADTSIENGSDRHALIINRDTCTLYELFALAGSGSSWTAGSGAIFQLGSDTLRPLGWTSADAAGLPIFPGLVRWDEVQAGAINHAIRVTAQRTDQSFLWPARHQAGAAADPSLPPMGARFRLKAGFDTSRFSAQARVILGAMQHYGLIVADNGSNWFFSGTQDAAWPDSLLSELKTIPASQFEAVDESALMVDPNSAAVGTAPAPATGRGPFRALVPARILDTRNGIGAPRQAIGPNGSLSVQVTGVGGVPTTGASAVVLNVTVTNTTAASYLTVWPSGFPQPLASNLNWTAGQTVPNLVEAAVGSGGQVSIYNAFGRTDVIFDVAGYVASPTSPGPDGLFNPVVPFRVLDTRTGNGAPKASMAAGQTIVVQVGGRIGSNVPASGVSAVVLNLTATNPTMSSYLTVWPAGTPRPLASNLNLATGQTVSNRVVVAVGTGTNAGQVNIYNAYGNVDVVADVGGWFTDATSAAGGSRFVALTPSRILDTRTTHAPVGPNASITLSVAGQGGVPGMNSTVPPTAVVLNVTVTNATAASYLTIWPDGTPQPLASDLNYVPGSTVPNLVVVKLGTSGSIDFFNAFGWADVIVDVAGWSAI